MCTALHCDLPRGAARNEALEKGTVRIESAGGTGSGFCVRKADGKAYILTNEHVVVDFKDDPAVDLQVVSRTSADAETTSPAQVLAIAEGLDLALLEIDDPGPELAILPMAPSSTLKQEQKVVAAGFPFGTILSNGEIPRVSSVPGRVLDVVHDETGIATRIDIETEVYPGNSGGPVTNSAGEVIGVIVAGSVERDTAYAIPIALAQNLLAGFVPLANAHLESGRLRFDLDINHGGGEITNVGLNVSTKPPAEQHPFQAHGDTADQANIFNRSSKAQLSYEVADPRGLFYQLWYRNEHGVTRSLPRQLPEDDATQRSFTSFAYDTMGRPAGDEWLLRNVDGIRAVTVIRFDELIGETIVAGSGDYVVLRLGNTGQLAVLDTNRHAIVSRVELECGDFLLAAGGESVVLYWPHEGRIERRRLPSLEPVRSATGVLPPVVEGIWMGSARGDQAMLIWRRPDWKSRDAPLTGGFVYLDEFDLLMWPDTPGYPGSKDDDVVMAPQGNSWLEVDGGMSPELHTPMFEERGTNIATTYYSYDHDRPGCYGLNDQGYAFSTEGFIAKAGRRWLVNSGHGTVFYPAMTGSMYLSTTRRTRDFLEEVRLHDLDQPGKATRLPIRFGLVGEVRGCDLRQSGLRLSRRVIFRPETERIILFPRTNDRVVLFHLQLAALVPVDSD